jgi:hypothetical protein
MADFNGAYYVHKYLDRIATRDPLVHLFVNVHYKSRRLWRSVGTSLFDCVGVLEAVLYLPHYRSSQECLQVMNYQGFLHSKTPSESVSNAYAIALEGLESIFQHLCKKSYAFTDHYCTQRAALLTLVLWCCMCPSLRNISPQQEAYYKTFPHIKAILEFPCLRPILLNRDYTDLILDGVETLVRVERFESVDTLFPNEETLVKTFEWVRGLIQERHTYWLKVIKIERDALKRELMEKMWHPDRVLKLLEAGIDVEDM